MGDEGGKELSSKKKISRREALKVILSFSGAVLVEGLAYFAGRSNAPKIKPYLNDVASATDAEIEKQNAAISATNASISTQNARVEETFQSSGPRIKETAEAYRNNPDILAKEMDKIPESLKTHAVELQLEFKGYETDNPGKAEYPSDFLVGASGTIVGPGIILTARHVIDPIPAHVHVNGFETVGFRRLSTVDSKQFLLPAKDFSMYILPSMSLEAGLIVCHNPIFPKIESQVVVDTNWVPQIGESLHCLSFPGSIRGGQEYIPQTFGVTKIVNDSVYCKDISSGGESGGGVFNDSGKLVGVLFGFSADGGVEVFRLGKHYTDLLNLKNS